MNVKVVYMCQHHSSIDTANISQKLSLITPDKGDYLKTLYVYKLCYLAEW